MEKTGTRPLLQPSVPVEEEESINTIFNQIEERFGFVPDGVRLYGTSPVLLESLLTGASYFLQHSGINQTLLALIRYLTSDNIGCSFCISFNEGILLQLGLDIETIRSISDDPAKAPLEEREKALLAFALKAVTEPESVNRADVDHLRTLGWTEQEIFEVVVMAANTRAFNLVLKTFKVREQGAFV